MVNGRMKWSYVAGLLAAGALLIGTAMAQGKTQTFTGTVSDAMCGAKHKMADISAKDCTNQCVKMGSNYALVVGGKVYTLWVKEKGAAETLESLAGGQAKVTGTVDGDTIHVASVSHT